ncbi:MAG: hypothetical protein AABY16_01815 [Nanoarchaeota archaeon]
MASFSQHPELSASVPRLKVTDEDIKYAPPTISDAPITPGTERQRAAELIAYRLSKRTHTQILELAREHRIDIPPKHLRLAAKIYANRVDSNSLTCAVWAYDQIGEGETARIVRRRSQDLLSDELDQRIARHKEYLNPPRASS